MVMATQTYVTDMQVINPASAQQTSQTQIQVQNSSQGQQTQASGVPAKPGQASQAQPTIIQPSQTHAGQQFIVTIQDSGGEQQVQAVQETVQLQQAGTHQVLYQPHPQYVEGSSSDPAIYAASNGQMQNYTGYGETMYTPVTGTYYPPSGSPSTQMASAMGFQGQILTGGGTYLVQGGAIDGDGHPITHTTRASPATETSGQSQSDQRSSHFDVKSWQREVQWLIDNYETAEGVSLPRSTLYNHYLRHCQEAKMDPMNPASFGKLIRSVFLGLRTRRLGTRGNSKYHYYGIRIKAASALNQYTDDQTIPIRQQPNNPHKRFKAGGQMGADGQDGAPGSGLNPEANTQQHQHQQFLGDASGAIPEFEEVEMGAEVLPEGITSEHVMVFEQLYKEHCEAILDIVVNLQFNLIEALWQNFWRNTNQDQQRATQNGGTMLEHQLPKDKLHVLCRFGPVQTYVRRSDYAFYQALVEVLIPDVLRPIPSSLTQAIRHFAKSLEGWLKGAMVGVPEEMIKTKIGAVGAFAQTLRRYTSLNHLAQAARAVLQNTQQINQMLTDLNRVDFANVQEQASWVCQCDDSVVHQLEQDFKKTLQEQNSLEQWAEWLESVVNQVLKTHEGCPNFPKAARQFLLKWSFYSSMVIRDLTLRSAASFGSFHLIRLLYDEYMFYLVEHRVASATGETPIAVMGEVRQFIDLGSVMALGTQDSEPTSSSTLTLLPSPATILNIKPKIITSSINHISQLTGTIQTSAVTTTTTMTPTQQASLAQLTNSTNPTTVTVVAASGTAATPTKTIVVVPVSAASGSGDGLTTVKRIKTL